MKTAILPRGGELPVGSTRARSAKIDNLQFRRVLVPLDFSAASRMAIEYALPLAKEFGSELHFVHVFEPDYPLASMMAMPLVLPEMETGSRVRRHLHDWAKSAGASLGPRNVHAIKGRPFDEICRLAREIDIDLIVMSTHGWTGLKHFALGSTAERVVRFSPCPVLIVPAMPRQEIARRDRDFSLEIERIAVPVDFSECSMEGLAYAKALARRFHAKLLLLHAIALKYYISSDEYARFDYPMVMREVEQAAREEMSALARALHDEGIDVENSLQIGHAGEQVCAAAKDAGADLIVTSTHGRTGLRHVLIGSTAEYIVRHAYRPVLVVPSHEREIPAVRHSKR